MTFKNIFLLMIGFSVFTLAQNVYTTGDVLSGWQSQARNDVMIRSNENVCHRADSAAAGKNFFIPTRSPAEWSAVNANKPAGLSITPCVCEPLTIDTASCAIANGSGSRLCWSNGAAWGACTQACNPGYTLSGGVCVPNITYVYHWRSYMPDATPYNASFVATSHPGVWYRLWEGCQKEIVGANPYNAGAVGVDDQFCIDNERPKNPPGCGWQDYYNPGNFLWECH